MLKSEIEFQEQDDLIAIYYEDDRPPFSDKLMGSLIKDLDGYYRFHPARLVVMTQKHLRTVAAKVSELNLNPTNPPLTPGDSKPPAKS